MGRFGHWETIWSLINPATPDSLVYLSRGRADSGEAGRILLHVSNPDGGEQSIQSGKPISDGVLFSVTVIRDKGTFILIVSDDTNPPSMVVTPRQSIA